MDPASLPAIDPATDDSERSDSLPSFRRVAISASAPEATDLCQLGVSSGHHVLPAKPGPSSHIFWISRTGESAFHEGEPYKSFQNADRLSLFGFG